MKLKKILISMFAVIAVITSAIVASFAGMPVTTANAASDDTLPTIEQFENDYNFALVTCGNPAYVVTPGVWYKFLSGKIASFSTLSGADAPDDVSWNINYTDAKLHGYLSLSENKLYGEYIQGRTFDEYTEMYVRFNKAYTLNIPNKVTIGEKYTDYMYVGSLKVKPEPGESGGTEKPSESADTEKPGESGGTEKPSESTDTEKPGESGDVGKPSESESEGRFVDKASQWLSENLSVKVSSATIGAVIIIGVLILIFKRK